MQTHILKTYPKPFQAIWNNSKLFEIRKNDRDFKIGDWLDLKEYISEENRYTGRFIECHVNYMAIGPECELPYGLVVMGIKIIGKFSNIKNNFKDFNLNNF